ncbi:hypothetical protein LUZ60_010941 [Juncus effusus]|nr:hypothetical protein LUZ60_010941 [Juncus effusus]
MCGIFAYLNYNVERKRSYILEVLLNGLRRLEYRGYDSAGIAVDSDLKDGCDVSRPYMSAPPLVFRQEGKVESLVGSVYSVNLEKPFLAHAGIAHTRWATHGVPAPRNSHPQSSGEFDEFVVVHNGIITNYEVLKTTLVRHGFTFTSDTDTEVIPKLAKFIFDKARDAEEAVTFSQVVMEVMRQLEGAYALIFKSPHYPNELIACKRGSTLILGVNELGGETSRHLFHDVKALTSNDKPKELFFSSDHCAIVENTKNCAAIEDNEIVHIKDGSVSILKFDKKKEKPASVQRALSVLEMEVEQITKGDYKHFMQKEIHEQPQSLTTSMRGRLKDGSICLGGLTEHMTTIRRSGRICFIGCGTSFHASLSVEPLFEELTDISTRMLIASNVMDRKALVYKDDTCIFVSQSGETADTLQALDYALETGALCVGVTNTVGSTLARKTHCGVHIHAGCEISVASTKAYTSQIVVMVMMALAIGSDRTSTLARREAVIAALSELPKKAEEVLKLDSEIKELAKCLMNERSLMVFGRGYNYATALEGALKVMEIAILSTHGIVAGEMKHGQLALVDETMLILVIATRDDLFSKQQSVIQQLHARKGRLIVMCSQGDAKLVSPDGRARVIEVPNLPDCLQPVVNIIPLQLLAYHLTVLRGFDVDQPRNLAKSVTTQ